LTALTKPRHVIPLYRSKANMYANVQYI